MIVAFAFWMAVAGEPRAYRYDTWRQCMNAQQAVATLPGATIASPCRPVVVATIASPCRPVVVS
jgi:hypothetical protein